MYSYTYELKRAREKERECLNPSRRTSKTLAYGTASGVTFKSVPSQKKSRRFWRDFFSLFSCSSSSSSFHSLVWVRFLLVMGEKKMYIFFSKQTRQIQNTPDLIISHQTHTQEFSSKPHRRAPVFSALWAPIQVKVGTKKSGYKHFARVQFERANLPLQKTPGAVPNQPKAVVAVIWKRQVGRQLQLLARSF